MISSLVAPKRFCATNTFSSLIEFCVLDAFSPIAEFGTHITFLALNEFLVLTFENFCALVAVNLIEFSARAISSSIDDFNVFFALITLSAFKIFCALVLAKPWLISAQNGKKAKMTAKKKRRIFFIE